jgi:low temperature requirement protein LtrA
MKMTISQSFGRDRNKGRSFCRRVVFIRLLSPIISSSFFDFRLSFVIVVVVRHSVELSWICRWRRRRENKADETKWSMIAFLGLDGSICWLLTVPVPCVHDRRFHIKIAFWLVTRASRQVDKIELDTVQIWFHGRSCRTWICSVRIHQSQRFGCIIEEETTFVERKREREREREISI